MATAQATRRVGLAQHALPATLGDERYGAREQKQHTGERGRSRLLPVAASTAAHFIRAAAPPPP